MSDRDPKQRCVICGNMVIDKEAGRHMRNDGLQTLLNSCAQMGDDLQLRLVGVELKDVKFHEECRRRYNDKRQISRVDCPPDPFSPSKKRKSTLRSQLASFNWDTDCFLCCGQARVDSKHPGRNPVYQIRTTDGTREKLLELCNSDHAWSEQVKTRLYDCFDLVAVEARYHYSCYKDFTRPRRERKQGSSNRPTDEAKNEYFAMLCQWLDKEGDAEIFSVDELWEKMCDLAATTDVYSKKWLKSLLKERYGEHIFFANIGGSRKEAVCFRNMASYIVNEQWYSERSGDSVTEKKRIMTAAAKLVREEIREGNYNKDKYPDDGAIRDFSKMSEFIVPSLKIFLDVLLNRELWKVALGQALIQAARPRSVIAPLLFGLGVELDHIFGSKWVVSQLYSLGFCISADEVALFKNSILQDEERYSLSTSEEIDSQVMDNETPCYQFVADNADANIVTLDGTGTFHGTGLIRWIKRGMVKSKPKSQVLRRARLQVSELCKKGGIQTRTYYRSAIPALSQLKLSPLLEIQIPHIVNSSEFYTTLLWRSSELLRKALQPAPNWINWSGYVEAASSKDTISVDDIHILPLLDLNPNDESTIFSLICYVDKQARQCKMPCTTITFDQPLYIKAVEVTAAIQCETVVVRLGGFHTLMNAVGAIFHLMRGSGIEEAMMEVYGENTVPHIMSGKAIARALRAINLLDSSLHIKLLEFLQPVEADATDNDDNIVPRLTEEQLTSLSNLLEKSLELSSEYDLDENPVLQTLASRLSLLQSTLSSTSRTAKLWIQFINYASCVKRFIYAERTKNWDAHLVGCSDFLNLFAATGHIHYAKSCRLYIQQMQALPHTHPWLYALYSEKGLHAVQRTEHPLNGLWSDLTIEQFLMASLKSRSGLTHGKGLSESVRYQWVHTMHHRAAIHDAMTTLTGRRRTSSNQHVELGTSRKHRDQADLAKFRQWLDNHNPFEPGIPVLRSLSTGITATEDINCDRAEEVGYKIQTSLDNKPYTEAKIKRKDQIRTLQDLLPGVRVGKKVIHVDPTTLFLRCVEVAKRLGSDFRAFFRYEMCSVPTSLFKDNCMLKTQKSALAAKLLVERDIDQLQTDFFVIDGGWLLHRITWKRNVTFNEILCQYSEFVRQRFACKCIIVMDGYVESNIKDHERLRRINGKVCGDVMVRLDTLNKYHQSNFLSNNTNKSRIVELLAARLSEDGHIVRKCSGDADITIANDALRLSSEGNNVQVVCNDTDVVCMLVYHVFQRGDNASGQIVLRKEPLPGKPKSGGLFCIQDICGKIHSRQAEALLFIHAWSGCDTTSSLFKHGKLELYNDIVKSERLVAIAEKMKSTDMSQTRIGDLGAEIFCRQFGDQNSNDLTTLRHTKFQMMITENLSKLDPRLLPPTPRASYYHSLTDSNFILSSRQIKQHKK